jgi:hypothetical protein
VSTPPIVVDPRDVTPAPRRRAAVRRDRRLARRERARLRREERGPVDLVLWIPTTLLFSLLAPFALVLTPFLYLAPRRVIPNPARMIAMLGVLLLSMGGTVVEIDAPDTRVRLRLF